MKNNKWKWLGVFTAAMLIWGIGVGVQAADTRVMFGYDAEDRTGIYINDYRLDECEDKSYDECMCDPACELDDGEGCYNTTAGTLRLFGEERLDAAFPYSDPAGPIDPESDEAPEKDFLTWNPAIMPDAGPGSTDFYREALMVNGNNANEKVFLRQWFVPEYKEPRGRVWTDQSPVYTEDIVKEYTFMLLDTSNRPYPGSAGSTSFIFPTAYSNEDQIGLDGWDVDSDGNDDPTLLNEVASNYIDIGTGQLRLQSDNEDGDFPTDIEFLDHRAEISFVGSSISSSWAMVKIFYPSAYNAEDPIGASEFVMGIGDTLVAGRHEVSVGPGAEPTPVLKPWYLKLVAVDITTEPYTVIVKVGRLVQEGETFFSDGAEYDVAKIQKEGNKLLYITLRNPLPKDRDVHLPSLTVWKKQVRPGAPFPMLPPFNKEHAVIDDISGSTSVSCSFPVVADVCPVVERWVRQTIEPRFTTRLCEILKGLGWDSLDVETLPNFYTELMLPEQDDAPGRPGDYLLTSSFKAPNSDYARVTFHYDAAPSGGLTDVYINDGIRVYGEDSISAAFPYTDPSGPFDPESDEAPGKDFITFNPAIMPDAGPGTTDFYRRALMVNGNDASEKVFLRQWYVPAYPEPTGKVWTDQSIVRTPDIVKEYTFMLLKPSLEPSPGSAGSTSFIFPTAYDNSENRDNDQIGLESWDVDNDGEDDPTLLNEVGSNYIDIGTGQHRLQGTDTDPDNFPSDIEFLDHRAEIDFVGSSQGVSWINVTIYYPGAFGEEDPIGATNLVMNPGDKLIAGRHVVQLDDNPEPIMMPWYLELIAVDIYTHPYTAIVKVGRLLQEGESFFSDGAEYDVAKIHTVGDELLYITLRNPLPKDRDVELASLTVIKEQVRSGRYIPMLPPFNKTHAVIDDIGLTGSCGCTYPVVTGIPAVEESWISQRTEPRFTTKLCEILDGLGWREQTFRTLPQAYTEFDLPLQKDAVINCGPVTPGDYLFTSSWVLQDGGIIPPPPQTYCLSGSVTDAKDNPIPGIMVTADGVSASTETDGTYKICELLPDTYLVAPDSEAYTFDPLNRSVPITTADVGSVDFKGTPVDNGTGPFSISGKVRENGTNSPIEGVTIDVSKQVGGTVGSAATGSDGHYVISDIPGGENYKVTPTKGDCTFEPEFVNINSLADNQVGLNFTGTCNGTTPIGPPVTPPTDPDDPVVDPDDPVVDPADPVDPERAQISIQEGFLIRSKWLILPSFLTIRGTNTSFNASSKITFEPRTAVIKLMQRVVDEENIATFVLVMPSWFAFAEGQQIGLKVTTGPEEARSALDVKMLSTVLAGE